MPLVNAAFDVRPGEGAAVGWAALTFFLLLTSYFILRPVRDAVVLDGPAEFIPWLWTSTSVAMVALAAPWGWLVTRLPRRSFVPLVYRAFAAQILILAALLHAEIEPILVGRIFYVWVSVFNLFVVSVFWSLCADVSRPEQGRRLFAPIAAGGTAGTLAGSLLSRELAATIDAATFLLISLALLEAAVWSSRALDRAARAMPASAAPAAAAPIGGNPLAGFTALRSPYLAGIAVYVLLTACLATFVYLDQAAIVKQFLPTRGARTAYFADVELWTGIITMAIQLLLTARLLRWLGVGAVLFALPVAQAAGALALHTDPTLQVAAAVSATSRGVTHALGRPARELLFTAVPREDKYKAKNVVDTFVYRLGDFASAWLFRGLQILGVANAAVALPMVALWSGLAFILGAMYKKRS
jgi:AAA family ATP:ADP antiporter